jgi:hypothetical protein
MNVNGMPVIAFYAGRFQPMGRHHKMTYDWATQTFGTDNVFIISSDKVDPPKSPLNFLEKKMVATSHGVPDDKFVNERIPYAAATWKNIPQILNARGITPDNAVYVYIVGAKDMAENPRFRVGMKKPTKRNPNPGPTYFQNFDENADLEPGSKHGYLAIAPHMEHSLPNGNESSGTNLRAFLANASPDTFEAAMGFYDPALDDMFKSKFTQTLSETKLRALIRESLKRYVQWQ